jgi:hypothetical protein
MVGRSLPLDEAKVEDLEGRRNDDGVLDVTLLITVNVNVLQVLFGIDLGLPCCKVARLSRINLSKLH